MLLAGADQHLVLTGPDRLGYARVPTEATYRPSIDVFFDSLNRHWEADVIGVLLSGMGRDGARGLRQLRTQGGHTMVQDRATSAVYGMPQAAIELDGVDEILSPDRIAARLVHLAAGTKRGRPGLALNANR